jgi:uncharacterized membrane protein YdjX (TVP38/TMEM64 family)
MRLFIVFIAFAALVLVSFFIWGDTLMQMFSMEGSIAWLEAFGPWTWLAVIVLLVTDLFLPLPATIIMSASGYLHGIILGSIINIAGSFASGSLGYWLCRSIGQKAALSILGWKEFQRGRKVAENLGPWIVVLSRWLPVFPEVVSCMAGLTRMNSVKFHLALLTGTIPMAIIYTYIGFKGTQYPMAAILLSAFLPPVIWLVVSSLLRSSRRDL